MFQNIFSKVQKQPAFTLLVNRSNRSNGAYMPLNKKITQTIILAKLLMLTLIEVKKC